MTLASKKQRNDKKNKVFYVDNKMFSAKLNQQICQRKTKRMKIKEIHREIISVKLLKSVCSKFYIKI